MHHAFAFAASQKGLGQALSAESTRNGFRDNVVVPSFRYVDPDAIKTALKAAQLPEAALVAHMKTICTDFDADDDFFSNALVGKHGKGCRITTPTAELIHKTLSSNLKKGPEHQLPSRDRLFPENSRAGPKKKAKPLAPDDGNLFVPLSEGPSTR
jgi:hypothetical protein